MPETNRERYHHNHSILFTQKTYRYGILHHIFSSVCSVDNVAEHSLETNTTRSFDPPVLSTHQYFQYLLALVRIAIRVRDRTGTYEAARSREVAQLTRRCAENFHISVLLPRYNIVSVLHSYLLD